MPAALSYPGVYIQELSSGVHTITGVVTSIGAFFGQASMGPINVPKECFSYADYTRAFGAPLPGANLAQYVQQFFSNGGSDCFVTRLANGATPAQVTLHDVNKDQVLVLSAASLGVRGAGLSVQVDYHTATPDSTFNLRVAYAIHNVVVKTETLGGLSMDPSSHSSAAVPRCIPARSMSRSLPAAFVLGQLRSPPSKLESGAPWLPVTWQSASRGLTLVMLGVILMSATIVVQHDVETHDISVYFDRTLTGAGAGIPPQPGLVQPKQP
jgi:hypothetical protein